MQKGWHLVSLYTEKYPFDPEKAVYVDFAHYTGKYAQGGGHEYDKTLSGHLSFDELRRALRKHLEVKPGNANKRRRVHESL